MESIFSGAWSNYVDRGSDERGDDNVFDQGTSETLKY